MPREKITLTDEFKAAVKAYQQANKISSWSQALLNLAAIGYKQETGAIPPKPYDAWGGNRHGKQPDELDLERLEVKLLGLPPLADDD